MKIAILTLLLVLSSFQIASAGCRVNISFKNNAVASNLEVTADMVRIKGGSWAILARKCYSPQVLDFYSINMRPGSRIDGNCNLRIGCNFKRRYRFRVKNLVTGIQKYVYFPSANGFYRKGHVNLRFGNLAKYVQ